MLTTVDKGIVAIIGGVIQIGNAYGYHWGIDPTLLTSIVSTATAAAVYFVPNLKQ